MPETKKPQWKAPALRLIDAAEKLIGELGVDGVSLVQIARKAGQANKYAVQYHFGTREKLLRAIFETRLQRIGERRRKRLDALIESGAVTVRGLLAALMYPVYEEVGADGLHHYAKFAARVLDSPLAEETWFKTENFTTAAEFRKMLLELTPHLSAAEFEVRLGLTIEMLIGALALIDRATAARTAGTSGAYRADAADEHILDTAIAIAATAFQPLQPS